MEWWGETSEGFVMFRKTELSQGDLPFSLPAIHRLSFHSDNLHASAKELAKLKRLSSQ